MSDNIFKIIKHLESNNLVSTNVIFPYYTYEYIQNKDGETGMEDVLIFNFHYFFKLPKITKWNIIKYTNWLYELCVYFKIPDTQPIFFIPHAPNKYKTIYGIWRNNVLVDENKFYKFGYNIINTPYFKS